MEIFYAFGAFVGLADADDFVAVQLEQLRWADTRIGQPSQIRAGINRFWRDGARGDNAKPSSFGSVAAITVQGEHLEVRGWTFRI